MDGLERGTGEPRLERSSPNIFQPIPESHRSRVFICHQLRFVPVGSLNPYGTGTRLECFASPSRPWLFWAVAMRR